MSIRPTPIADCEELIYFYERVRYKWIETGNVKICFTIQKKCQELGICMDQAWRIIRFAKRIGMLERTANLIK